VSKTEIFYEDIKPLKLQKIHLKNQVKNLIYSEIKKMGDITLIFCSDKYLLDINVNCLNHNYYTDIITFNYVEGETISGDLFISIDRIKENSKEFNTTFIKELYRVIFHGILHLIGFNDKTEEEQKIMRGKEDLYLSAVDFGGIEI
jgi:probable rRNA maturation factor